MEVSRLGQASVVDFGSTNGTTVDGVPATKPLPLTADTVLEIGGDRLQWMPLTTAPQRTRRRTRGCAS
jgi:S-DNA-T family DNA segregation ATPase FtsK/SpoIIIE